MQISFKTVIPLPMFRVYRRFEELMPLRYLLPGWTQPYPIAYTTIGGDRYWFSSGAELERVGAIDDTYRPDLLGEERYGFMVMTITLYAPERTPLGTVWLTVHDHYTSWTELVVAPSAELPTSYYECWWFIVEVVQTFATQLQQAAVHAQQNQTGVAAPAPVSARDVAPRSDSSDGAQGHSPGTHGAASRSGSRPRVKGGRPRNPIDDWAWEQIHALGRSKAAVYAEWQYRNAERDRSLSDPERSFKHAIARGRCHPDDVWAWEQVHLAQRSVAEVFAEWQRRNQQTERILTDPEQTFAFIIALDRPPGTESA